MYYCIAGFDPTIVSEVSTQGVNYTLKFVDLVMLVKLARVAVKVHVIPLTLVMSEADVGGVKVR